MPVYDYVATDVSGARRTGTVDAHSEDLALSLLKTQGLYVISLIEKRNNIVDSFLNFRGVPENDVVNFTRQFSAMTSAGLPLARTLEILADQSTNKKMKSILFDILRDVEGGAPLSVSMGRFPNVFSNTYRALIRTGESSGKLDGILKRLADTMEAMSAMKSKFKAAMIYPAIIMLAMAGVFVMMMVFVIPKLAEMYKSLNVELPIVTKIMIAISEVFTKHALVLLAVVVALAIVLRLFLKSLKGKEFVAYISFKLPVFGKLNKLSELTEFARTLSLLIGSAVPIVESLKIISDVVVNKTFRDAALEAAKRVEKGSPLSEYFKINKNFPPLFGQMAAVGEETGQLDASLDKVADYFATEVDNSVAGLSAALEPLILILLGAMVGVLIISIITPIYKLTTSI